MLLSLWNVLLCTWNSSWRVKCPPVILQWLPINSCKISSIQNFYSCCNMAVKICTGSLQIDFFFQNNTTAKIEVMAGRIFARFQFKMSFGGISYIVTTHQGPLLLTWISNYVPRKVWDAITYPFLNFNGAFHPTLDNGCNYLSMLGLKLNMLLKGATGLEWCGINIR